jgi:hypothetical protein
VRPNKVSDKIVAVPILGSSVPFKGTRFNAIIQGPTVIGQTATSG